MGWKNTTRIVLISALLSHAALASWLDVKIGKVFAPRGFDNNDKVQLALGGTLPDGCHEAGKPEVKVDTPAKTIFLKQPAFRRQAFCLTIFVPYSKMVDVGKLDFGEYMLKDMQTGADLITLPVAKAKSDSVDDFRYAPVESVSVVREDNKPILVINAHYPDKCSSLRDVLITYEENVIVAQPILNDVPANCGPAVENKHRIALRDDLKGLWLLHVRAANGHAVNRMIDFGAFHDPR